ATQQSDRNAEERRQEQELAGSDDSIGHAAAGLSDGLGQFGEEVPIHVFAAVVDEISENKEKDRDSHERAKAGQAEHDDIYRLAPKQAHVRSAVPRPVVKTISKRAKPLSTKVSRKSTRPSSTSALR